MKYVTLYNLEAKMVTSGFFDPLTFSSRTSLISKNNYVTQGFLLIAR